MIYVFLANLTVTLHLALIILFIAALFLSLTGQLRNFLFMRTFFWVWIVGKIGSFMYFGTCIFTLIENHLRSLGGQAEYSTGFVIHYTSQIGIVLTDDFVFWLVTLPVVLGVLSEAYWKNRYESA